MNDIPVSDSFNQVRIPSKVFVVDDDDKSLHAIRMILQQAGFENEGAADGLTALEMILTWHPDIILLDVFMPGLDGVEVCRQIKADPALRHIPVISLTANYDRETKMRCLDAGASDFLAKPIDYPELMMKVRNQLRLREFEDLRKEHELVEQRHVNLKDVFKKVADAKEEWEKTIDGIQDMVMLIDSVGSIRRCNKQTAAFFKMTYQEIIGKNWLELLKLRGIVIESAADRLVEVGQEQSHRVFEVRLDPIQSDLGQQSTSIIIRDITEQKEHEEALRDKNAKLEKAYGDLKVAKVQAFQQEKLASIGQIAAGVAHEINNPTGFIMSNLGTLQKYADKFTEFIRIQDEALTELATPHSPPLARGEEKGSSRTPEVIINDLASRRKALKIDYITDDLMNLVKESLDGAERIKKIVQDLKGFARTDGNEMQSADINAGIESTINVVWNELKYKATVHRNYGDLPQTICNLGQLNQVFMNLLVNAAHAIEKSGDIRITTWAENGFIHVSISDTGCGIPTENLTCIFEPFFTTKDVGKGTGLGLSIAFEIVKKHHGDIQVASEVGKGATFTVSIPIVNAPEGERKRGKVY